MSHNVDIVKERESASFNPDDVTCQLYGSEEMYERRRGFELAEDDAEYKVAERFPSMDRDDVYTELVRIFPIVQNKIKKLDLLKLTPEGRFGSAMMAYAEAAMLGPNPFSLHTSMFMPAIRGQGTPEQLDKLLPEAQRHKFNGTYAQTEMGHGTFLRGLETTATYDKSSEEFVIHCPTASSMKYWPGGLGKTANAAVVMAQLVVDGKSHGPHAFFCQLRDLDTHQPLPGVEVGDINRKFGYGEVDNGYLKFTQYRIPRTNMLMKNATVQTDGTYQRKALPQVTYLTMTFVRAMIVGQASSELARAATISTRYSAVRRQTANTKGEEPQILSYQTQQMKIFPAITAAYAFHFCAQVTRGTYFKVYADVQNGDVSRLAELHALSSGLKAYCSDVSSESIEVCRRACGGHGYSHASGIPRIIQRMIPAVTYEGENTVLYLQCARSLMKFYGMAVKGERVPDTMQFLCNRRDMSFKIEASKTLVLPELKSMFALNALRMIDDVADRMRSYDKSHDSEIVWNNHTVQLVQAAKAYTMYLTVRFFIGGLDNPDWETNAKSAMSKCCHFYTVHTLLENSGMFLQNNVLTPQHISILKGCRVDMLTELRPDAVALVDAFDFPDRLLNSCLGRYDGQVYDALYEYAKNSPLNQHQVHPSYHKYVKPMQLALKSQL